jgi:LysM repeat protein
MRKEILAMKHRHLRHAKILVPVVLLLVLLLLPPATHASGQIHIVRPGENLYRISIRYGTTVQAIARANGIRNPSLIYVGQRLIIPGGGGGHWGGGSWGGCPCTYVVRRGDTLSAIAWRYGTSVWTLVRMNGLANPNYIWAGQRLCVPCGGGGGGYHPPACGIVHVVCRGDTVYSIARRYGTTVQAIARANHLYNPSYIWVGQRLCIPCY